MFSYSGPSQGLKIFWGLVVLGGDNVSPLVEIGLADLPNIGGAQPPPCDGPVWYIAFIYLCKTKIKYPTKYTFVFIIWLLRFTTGCIILKWTKLNSDSKRMFLYK